MSIIELEEWIKQVVFENKISKLSKSFEVEYETDTDNLLFVFDYSYKRNRYECNISVYHASEDNNAENVEAHTDEDLYYSNSLLDLVNQVAEDYGELFLQEFSYNLEKISIKF